MRHFHHVGLIGKYQHTGRIRRSALSGDVLLSIAECITQTGCRVALEARTAEMHGLGARFQHVLDIVEIGQQCDLAVVVGGDGTMLGAARQLAAAGVPLIGINQGRLGFITDIALEHIAPTLSHMIHGGYTQDHRPLIHGRVLRNQTQVFEALAFNDIVINRGSTSGMVELRIEVDGHFVSNQRADGLIVATSTGSTAYALSAGGPLLHPSVPGWVMVPIAPHTLSNRPIVLSDSCEIAIELVAGRKASANFDTQSLSVLQAGDRVLVRRSQHSATFLHPQGWNYFDTLREKLNWNQGGNT